LIELAADCGYVPTAVAVSGEEVIHTRKTHRAPDISPEDAVPDVTIGADGALVSALAQALRRAEQPEDVDRRPVAPQDVPRMPTAATAGVLRRAMLEQEPVWIGYADNAGSMSRRLVDVLASDAGAISVFDHNQGRIRTLVLSRITGAITASNAKEQHP
jgi:predicted DNA-binding transcriptional regulator YafY